MLYSISLDVQAENDILIGYFSHSLFSFIFEHEHKDIQT